MAIQANPDRDPITRAVDEQLQEHYRQQFRERFPQQIEQIMRLIGERVQNQLRDKATPVVAADIESLVSALSTIHRLHETITLNKE
jgi:hypothetical protein